ncbi:MAG: ParA family protein [Planctomycetes bacterium]|nr:ParA family protein [Planctomycetota bacterium]
MSLLIDAVTSEGRVPFLDQSVTVREVCWLLGLLFSAMLTILSFLYKHLVYERKKDFEKKIEDLQQSQSKTESVNEKTWASNSHSKFIKPNFSCRTVRKPSRPKVLAFVNYKGGVGKTTLCYSIGSNVARLTNKRVLLVDCDPQANLSDIAGWKGSRSAVSDLFEAFTSGREMNAMPQRVEAVSTVGGGEVCVLGNVLGSAVSLESFLVGAYHTKADVCEDPRKIWLEMLSDPASPISDFDYVIFDCPPAFGMLTQSCLAAVDYLFIPTEPVQHVYSGLKGMLSAVREWWKAIDSFAQVGGIVLNKVKWYGGKVSKKHRRSVEDLKNNFDGLFPENSWIPEKSEAFAGLGQMKTIDRKNAAIEGVVANLDECTNEILKVCGG